MQIGIEKSREEKIEGIKKASSLLAQNASSGVSATTDSNLINYEDIQNSYYNSAQNTLNSYNVRAQEYNDKANYYLNELNYSQKNYKSSVFKSALNSLNTYSKVASSWYSNTSGGA